MFTMVNKIAYDSLNINIMNIKVSIILNIDTYEIILNIHDNIKHTHMLNAYTPRCDSIGLPNLS